MRTIMGYLHAKVSTEQDPHLEVVGSRVLGSHNERGYIYG